MNFKNICVVLSLLSLSWNVVSSPIEKSDKNTEIVDVTFDDNDTQELLATEESSEEEVTFSGEDIENIAEDSDSTSEIEMTDTEECLTPECYEASKKILTSLDFSADPCDDFYQFTCGGWVNEQEEETNIFNDIYIRTRDFFIKALQSDYIVNEKLSEKEQQYDRKNFNKLKVFYESCMNSEKTADKKSEFIIQLVSDLKIKENKENYKTVDGLTDFVILLHEHFSSFLFSMDENVDVLSFTLEKAPLAISGNSYISKEEYEDPMTLFIEKSILKDALVRVYINENEEEINTRIESFLEFDKLLMFSSEGEEPVETTVKELNKDYPYIDWKKYLIKRFELYNIPYDINDDTVIINKSPKYLENMKVFLQEVDYDALLNYLEEYLYIMTSYVFMVQESNLKYEIKENLYHLEHPFEGIDVNIKSQRILEQLHHPFKNFHEKSLEDSNIGKVKLPKDEYCLMELTYGMPALFSQYYIENNFSSNLKEQVQSIVDNIKESMIHRLSQMEWLDEPTRNFAMEKVSKIKEMILTVDSKSDPESLYKNNQAIEVNSEDYYANVYQYMKNMLNRIELSQFTGTYRDEQLRPSMSIMSINAFYIPPINRMLFPSGVLQAPFIFSNVPDYVNYGSIGMVIGHELTHAFDGTGKQYDSNGLLNNWWTDNDNEEFNEFSQCFIDQYDGYYIEDQQGVKHYIDGTKNLNENLADNGGLSRAYEAWNISMAKDPEAAKENNKALPGLSDFTLEQLFYISFGQAWCDSETPDTIVNYYNDGHSPNNVRVNAAVSNSKQFSKAFNCPNTAKMNPSDKCLLW